MMNTPICDFVKAYKEKNALRLHMPGHKGRGFFGIEELDITEIPGADVLYQASGIIKESEENAALLFGSGKTLYSAEGSSLSIRAMLYLTQLYAKSKGEECVIAAARNAHRVFVTASALLDVDVEWIYPETESGILSCDISPDYLEGWLNTLKKKPTAVYITSPDYLGNLADIKGICEVCKKNGLLLLVDNAHGAYLSFLRESKHPLSLGADLCCDSAHKTLPALTGAAYLHISKTAPTFLKEQAERAMSLFASTSPSYLILQSLDSTNLYLSNSYTQKLERAINKYAILKEKLRQSGFELVGNEPLKLTLKTKSYGYTGTALSKLLEEKNIFTEFCDPDFVVMMLSVETADETIKALEAALLTLPKKKAIKEPMPKISRCEKVICASQAIKSPSKAVRTEESLNRIIASATVSCPPAIPIVSCGEKINEAAVEAMKYYGIDSVEVVV